MRPQARALGAVLALAASSGCSGSKAPDVARKIVIEETPLAGAVVQPNAQTSDGALRTRVLTAECGIKAIVGTHAEYEPPHPLCVVRVRVSNETSAFATFASDAADLVMPDRSQVPVALDVMNIKRQAHSVSISSHGVMELDLWFEPTQRTLPKALLLPGRDEAAGAPQARALVPLSWSASNR
jgi:hypothetical protein